MSEQLPEQETRGGKNIDWAHARPGQPLPEKPRVPDLDEDGAEYVPAEDGGPYDPARYVNTTGPDAS